jgi:TetR/AcrR family acrAB operon transcriptional repressor
VARCTKEEALETRERLLDAALEVFHAEGVSRPSLSKVAELAGATRGAVYGHFENKADLFSALCDRILLPAESLAEIRGRSVDDPLGALRAWCVYVLTDPVTNAQKRRLFEVIFHKCEMLDENGEIRQRRLKARAVGKSHVRELVALAVKRGQLAADLDVDAAAGLLHDSAIGVLSQWLLDPEAFDLPGRAERYADALTEMVRTSAALRGA